MELGTAPKREPDQQLEIKQKLIADLIKGVSEVSSFIHDSLLDETDKLYVRPVNPTSTPISGIMGQHLKRFHDQRNFEYSTWFDASELKIHGLRVKADEKPFEVVTLDFIKNGKLGGQSGEPQTALVRKKMYNIEQIERMHGEFEWYTSPFEFNYRTSQITQLESDLEVFRKGEGFEFEEVASKYTLSDQLSKKQYAEEKIKLWSDARILIADLVSHVADRAEVNDPAAKLIACYEVMDYLRIQPKLGSIKERFEEAMGVKFTDLKNQQPADFMASYNGGRELADNVKRTFSGVRAFGVEHVLVLKALDDQSAPQITSKESKPLKAIEDYVKGLGYTGIATVDRTFSNTDGKITCQSKLALECSDKPELSQLFAEFDVTFNGMGAVGVETALDEVWNKKLKGDVGDFIREEPEAEIIEEEPDFDDVDFAEA